MVKSEFLKAWLQRPDYQSGVEFYLLHGKNESLKKLFQSGPTTFTKKKLQEELAALASLPKAEPKPMVSKEPFVPVPDWAQKMGEERIALIKEQQWLRSQLIHYKSDEERRNPALRILEIVELVTAMDADMNEYKETGKVPIAVQEVSHSDFTSWDDIRLCEYLYNSIRSRISRCKDEEKRVDLLKEKALVEAEINRRRK